MNQNLIKISEEIQSKNWSRDFDNYTKSLIQEPSINSKNFVYPKDRVLRNWLCVGALIGGLLGGFLSLYYVKLLYVLSVCLIGVALTVLSGLLSLIVVPLFFGFSIWFGMVIVPFLMNYSSFSIFAGVILSSFIGGFVTLILSIIIYELSADSRKQFDIQCQTDKLPLRAILNFWNLRLRSDLVDYRTRVVIEKNRLIVRKNFLLGKSEAPKTSKNLHKNLSVINNEMKFAEKLEQIVNDLFDEVNKKIMSLEKLIEIESRELDRQLRKNQLRNQIGHLLTYGKNIKEQWDLDQKKIVSETLLIQTEIEKSLQSFQINLEHKLCSIKEESDQDAGTGSDSILSSKIDNS